MVRSRRMAPRARSRTQDALRRVLDDINDVASHRLVSRFVITLGDEFQGLLGDASCLPEVQWRIHTAVAVPIRWGVGYGTLATRRLPEALGMDGPVWHHARDAIDDATRRRHHTACFRGFGDHDAVLTGVAHILQHHREGLSSVQTETLDMLRDGLKQVEVAKRRGVEVQAVSKAAQRAGVDAYLDGERALIRLLSSYDHAVDWTKVPS